MPRSRILIAEDQSLLAELCKKLLETEFDVIGVVNDGQALIRAAHQLRPDVVLLDIMMTGLNGLDAGEQVKRAMPTVKLLYLTATNDARVAAEAFRRGASGYVLKTCNSSELVHAVRELLRGKTYVSTALASDPLDYLRRIGQPMVEASTRLTPRQREVLQLLAEGKVMKEIGETLNLTTRTVAFHKYRMMEVLGAKSSAELVRYAVRNRFVAA